MDLKGKYKMLIFY